MSMRVVQLRGAAGQGPFGAIRVIVAALSLLGVVAGGSTLAATSAQPERVAGPAPMPLISAQAMPKHCKQHLGLIRSKISALAATPVNSDAARFLARWNGIDLAMQDLAGPLDLLNNVSPDQKVRQAAEPCLVEFAELYTELFQNRALYQRVRAIRPTDPIDRKFRDDLLIAFEDSGITLPAKQRQRFKAIQAELEKIRQQYEKNIRDNPAQLVMAASEMKGLPKDYLERAKQQPDGSYQLGFSSPEYRPFMMYADDAQARRKFQVGYYNRGTAENLALLEQIVALRHELAALFGLPDYASYAVRRRMAGSAPAVQTFLSQVQAAVQTAEARDLDALRAFKAQQTGQALSDSEIARWDVEYWITRYQKAKFDIDQEALRSYFPAQPTIAWAFDVSSQLYDVDFIRRQVPVWHPDVEYYDVRDRRSGKVISGIYLDLYPRDGKYTHAAAFTVRGSSTLTGRLPVSALVTNFDRQGFNVDELETLLHEFGHVLHGVLSKTRYVSQAGTNVELDFVEAPSQMYEAWAHKKDALDGMGKFCPSCPKISDAMLEKLDQARRFGKGVHYARQWLYASYDMAIYSRPSSGAQKSPAAQWEAMERATAIGHIPGTEFAGQFSHVAGGYGAGYYGYMWSEVLAMDLLSAFEGRLMNPAVGMRFRTEILEQGAQKRGMAMVKAFLGRDPSPKAFFKHITGSN